MKHDLRIPAAGRQLCGELRMAERPAGIVVLVHGSGVTRQDPLNRFVAACVVRAGFAALLMDLLEECEAHDRHHIFDLETQAGVGAGVALLAAAKAPQGVGALVARGGRPDTAFHCLYRIDAPTLFIASESGADRDWVQAAYGATGAWKELVQIPSAGDSFREPHAIEAVAQHACRWFSWHLGGPFEPRIHALETHMRDRYPGSDRRVTVADRPPRAYERRRFNVRLDVSLGGRSTLGITHAA